MYATYVSAPMVPVFDVSSDTHFLSIQTNAGLPKTINNTFSNSATLRVLQVGCEFFTLQK